MMEIAKTALWILRIFNDLTMDMSFISRVKQNLIYLQVRSTSEILKIPVSGVK